MIDSSAVIPSTVIPGQNSLMPIGPADIGLVEICIHEQVLKVQDTGMVIEANVKPGNMAVFQGEGEQLFPIAVAVGFKGPAAGAGHFQPAIILLFTWQMDVDAIEPQLFTVAPDPVQDIPLHTGQAQQFNEDMAVRDILPELVIPSALDRQRHIEPVIEQAVFQRFSPPL